ncbi:MrpF/PhaF family protein [Acidipila rosea]|uniref:Multiple resistance and pH regulation protein F (MrpF/PhaF) n=1 Tax=Acidipila rosea TaxID=768535 RepID=A0A4R1L3F2_9BACT|nr:MrpF/PhaF family protein [Acidipila rosea]MBW4026486.1 hypothetical protein [Acidobacteriota bacterium]MBW4044378.1 hypothetical protein [Acidobacteriota bacterium]TCK72555.1 multiple resistance and pH regulation protein F (MrpF/PhaF) [Acidipila rosea]
MNVWLLASCAVGLCLVPCAAMCLQGSPERRLVGLEMTGTIVTLLLVLLTMGFHRPILMDLPLTVAIMSLAAGLVFARFLEKQL